MEERGFNIGAGFGARPSDAGPMPPRYTVDKDEVLSFLLRRLGLLAESKVMSVDYGRIEELAYLIRVVLNDDYGK